MPLAIYTSHQPLLHGSIFSILAEDLYHYKALQKDLRHTCKSSAEHSVRNIAVYVSLLETNAFNRDFLAFFTQYVPELFLKINLFIVVTIAIFS